LYVAHTQILPQASAGHEPCAILITAIKIVSIQQVNWNRKNAKVAKKNG